MAATKKKEETDAKNDSKAIVQEEKLKKPFLLLVLLTVLLALAMIFLYLLAGSTPEVPGYTENEQYELLLKIPNSVWNIDDNTKKTELEELSYQRIETLRFSGKDTGKDYLLCYLDTASSTTMEAKVRPGNGALSMEIDGYALSLWYTENEEGKYQTMTLKGADSWLFFTREED